MSEDKSELERIRKHIAKFEVMMYCKENCDCEQHNQLFLIDKIDSLTAKLAEAEEKIKLGEEIENVYEKFEYQDGVKLNKLYVEIDSLTAKLDELLFWCKGKANQAIKEIEGE